MLGKLAGFALRRHRLVLVTALVAVIVAGAAAAGLMGRLTNGGWQVPGSESDKAATILQTQYENSEPNLVLLVDDERGVDHAEVAEAGARLTDRFAAESGVGDVTSYWAAGRQAALKSEDGHKALIVGRVEGDFDARQKRVKELADEYSGEVGGLHVTLGGEEQMWNENLTQAADDAALAEALVFPIVLALLVIVFGSLVTALLPLSVAIVCITLSMGLFWLLTFAMDLSNFVLNTATFVGLGLAIDYSLLIVSRFREEHGRGVDRETALRNTLNTAGRTVVFSAVCVVVTLSALFAVPFPFFASMALGGIGTTVFAALAAITLVPAMIGMFGKRVDTLHLPFMKGRVREISAESEFWRRQSYRVMKRPALVSVLVLGFLVLLGLPALDMKLRLQDEQVLPPSAGSARVAKIVNEEFSTKQAQALKVVVEGDAPAADRTEALGAYAAKLSTLPHAERVDGPAGSYQDGRRVGPPTAASTQFTGETSSYLLVIPEKDALAAPSEQLVRDVRALPAPYGKVLVGGPSATSVDTFDKLTDALPLAIGLLAASMFVLLFLLTGSVLLPIKAIALTLLSLTATFGVLVYIFQDGHLKWLVGDFTATGATIWTVPVILFAMAFGLSMDYQVFIMSRIKEEHDRGKDNATAVADALARTGRVVTYAAVMISLVCAVWVTSKIGYMKAFGVGIPLAILMDALIVRGALLPAFMKLLGDANWWAPGPMRRLHDRFGLREESGTPPAPRDGAAAPKDPEVSVRT
ncbi:MMPL family transporter [Streptomyces sp. TRM76323]|uniref:MMPL family transporter n=1 Tax=Streptomyces tamarix TaxID=3078565 RepID=A0ABU3QJD9_9ACTN|nr:MMPL family transporter [Streptomyces tamarix]MDT9682492.1 MMPL family transporter [Streptomyces tamarix]